MPVARPIHHAKELAMAAAASKVKPIPEGYHTVTPYLMVAGAAKFIDFMVAAFGARKTEQMMRPDGSIGHTELRVGDSVIMLSEANAQMPATPVMLHLYVEDVDAAFDRAVLAGGVIVQKPTLQFYGDRAGGVKEPSGNTIWIASHVEDVPPEEMKTRAAEAMKSKG
jgi:PhnB protein